MINQQLLDYIKSQLQLGLTKEKISSDLLANGWTAQDIEEGFRTTASPVPTASYIPVSPTFINANTASPVQTNTRSNTKLFLTIFILFLLAGGGASAYFFRNDLVKLPILKDIFPNKNEVVNTEVPVGDVNQGQSLPPPTTNAATPTPANTVSVTDCGVSNNFDNFDCFIKNAKNRLPSEIRITMKEEIFGIIQQGVALLKINNQKDNKMSFYLKIESLKASLSPRYVPPAGMTNEQLLELKKTVNTTTPEGVGLEGTCIFIDSANLVDFLGKLKIKGPSSDVFNNLDCSGSYFKK